MNGKTRSKRRFRQTKAVSVLLSAALLATSFTGLGGVISSAAGSETESKSDYGLMDSCQEGTILHCFDWKYTDIIDELENIAKAGFTSVQTSPAQPGGGVDSNIWYYLYQPLGFYVGANDLGTKEELQTLCTEAHKYGIKVIVDVVANHLAGDHTYIQNDFRSPDFWRWNSEVPSSADSRYKSTHVDIGMPDLKSENKYVETAVKCYVQELKSIGVDGIRWDAVKHVQLPSEDCDFIPNVIDEEMYNYGEILDDASGKIKEYTNYMSVTDAVYASRIRKAISAEAIYDSSKGVDIRYTASIQYLNRDYSVDTNKIVYWGESHDTWSNNNDSGYSNEMTQNQIDRAYALAASREGATALYFSRPSYKFKESILAGVKGSTHFTSAEVAAVNHFHNAMAGQADKYVTDQDEDMCAVVCREQGAVVVSVDGTSKTVSVPNGNNLTAAGTYIDEITGNKWTVTNDTISGTIGDTGIAVLYNTAKYQVTVAESTAEDTTVSANVKIYFDKSAYSSWTNVYAYIYDESYGTTNKPPQAWPGIQLTATENGYYVLDMSKYSDFLGKGKIIFSDGTSSASKRYPADGLPGLDITNQSMIFTANNKWKEYSSVPATGSVSASVSDGTSFTGTQTVTLYANGVTNPIYMTSEGEIGSYTNGQQITIGSSIPSGTVKVTVKGNQSDGFITSQTYTYTKTGASNDVKIYFDNTTYNWSQVCAYIYDSDGNANTSYPGKAMTYNSTSKLYEMTVPTEFVADGRVFFTDGTSSTSNRYPYESYTYNNQKKSERGLDIWGHSRLFGADHSWTVYNDTNPSGTLSATADENAVPFKDNLTVTLYASDTSIARYATSEGKAAVYHDGDVITIGDSTTAGKNVTLELIGIGLNGATVTQTYTYQKDGEEEIYAYFDNSSYNWDNVYAYVYNSDGTSVVENKSWSGIAMTQISPTLYKYEIPDNLTNGKIIFNNNSGTQYPTDAGLSINEQSNKLDSSKKWTSYTPIGMLSASAETGTFTDSLTVTLYADAVTDSRYSINNGTSTAYENGDKITFSDTSVLTLTATDSNGNTMTETYTYTKEETEPDTIKIYFDNTTYNWSKVYVYAYKGSDNITAWPGKEMTKISQYLYTYEVPRQYEYIILNNGSGGDGNQNPKSGGQPITGTALLLNEVKNWESYTLLASLATGKAFADNLNLTFYAADDVTNTTYTINGVTKNYTDGENVVIPIDDSVAVGDTVTVTLSGQKDGKTVTKTYSYEKGINIYFDKPSSWSRALAYVYDSEDNKMSKWPGTEMTLNENTGLYEYVVTGDFINNGMVIFCQENGSKNRYPASGTSGLSINGQSFKLSNVNGTWVWEEYPIDISTATVTLADTQLTYNGNTQTAVVSAVTVNGTVLTEGTDYTVTGNTATDKGTYTLTVTGKGNYKGTVTKIWEIVKEYTVSYTINGTVTEELYTENAFCKVTAPKVDGKTFSHWSINGAVASTSTSYIFRVVSNTSLEAVYVDNGEEVSSKPAIAVTSVRTVGTRIYYEITRDVPKEYSVVSTGILYGTSIALFTNVDDTQRNSNLRFTDDSGSTTTKEKVYKGVSGVNTNKGYYSYSLNVGSNQSRKIYLRGYVIVKDADNNLTTYYTDIIDKSYNEVNS